MSRLITLLILFFIATGLRIDIDAQEVSSGVAVPVLLEQDAEHGAVICSRPGGTGYELCSRDNQPSQYGVITTKPAISIGEVTLEKEYFAISSGIAEVRVTSQNGSIAEGDLVTTSSVPGVAQKASRNGYVLGTALTAYSTDNSQDVGTIFVSINIHQTTDFTDTRTNLLEILREGLSSAVLTPIAALRYILAAIVVITSFVLAFIYFGRLARAGIEAIGRNPLAHRTIELTVVFHIAITIAIFLVGLGVAYLILVL